MTDDIREVYERPTELPHVMDPSGESYLRQEGRGLVIGFYEQEATPWAVDGTPADFGHELLDEALGRIGPARDPNLSRRRHCCCCCGGGGCCVASFHRGGWRLQAPRSTSPRAASRACIPPASSA